MARTSLKSYIVSEMLTVSNPLSRQLFLSRASLSLVIPGSPTAITSQTFSNTSGRQNLIRARHRQLRPHTQADSPLKEAHTANLGKKGCSSSRERTFHSLQIIYAEVWGCDVMVILIFLACPVIYAQSQKSSVAFLFSTTICTTYKIKSSTVLFLVPTVASDSTSWLTEEEPDMVFYCCSPFTSKVSMFRLLRYFSAWRSCIEQLFVLP